MKNNLIIYISLLVSCWTQTSFAQCTDDTHSTNVNDSFLSCQTTTNPNPARGMSHWMLYDLGEPYTLGTSHLWNYNVNGMTNQGANSYIIDYSSDGTNWVQLGSFNLAEAPGQATYAGIAGPNFGGQTVQYVLFTFVSNHNPANNNCIGISEARFAIAPLGCADYEVHETMSGDISSGWYYSDDVITSNGTVHNPLDVTIQSATCVVLESGFEVKEGAEFLGYVAPCGTPPPINADVTVAFANPATTALAVDLPVDIKEACRIEIITTTGQCALVTK